MSCRTTRMKRYHVRRAPASGPQWSEAALLNDFAFAWEPTAPPFTEFRALWDDARLHFRFDCLDEDLVLADGATAKDRVLGSDRVEIFFAADAALWRYHCFEMSPRGEVLAYQAQFHRQMDWDWSGPDLSLSAHIEANHYSVTGSFPLEALRAWNVLKPGSTEILAGLYRAEFSHQPDGTTRPGWMPWVHPQTEKPDFHVPASFGVLELLD